MPDGIKVSLEHRGASLEAVARELRDMTDAKVGELFKRHLKKAASPYPRYVRASVLAIPVTGEKHTGLRARIAQCVTLSSGRQAREAWVSVWVDPSKMAPDYKTLPLYMQGATSGRRSYARWRHPVYGRWLEGQRDQPSHPYFDQAVATLAKAAEFAIESALEDVTQELHG